MTSFTFHSRNSPKPGLLQYLFALSFWILAAVGAFQAWQRTYLLVLLAIAFSIQIPLQHFLPGRSQYKLIVGKENLIFEQDGATLWQIPLEQVTDIVEETNHPQHIEANARGRLWFIYTRSGDKYSLAGTPPAALMDKVKKTISL